MNASTSADPQLQVSAPDGRYRGWSGPVAAHWTGIAFAREARTTAERFSPLEPAARTNAVIDALPTDKPGRHTLSVTAPAGAPDPAAELPVVVFIHGGRYESGHANQPWYRGDAFARSGCVYISLNYRLRFDGFLPVDGEPYPQDFDATTEPTYYRAAEDVLMGLRWIQRNIAAFGGNPANVTLVGQSAGGTMATHIAGSPRARGLLHRCVVLSQGAPRSSVTGRMWLARLLLKGPVTHGRLSALSDDTVHAAYRRFARYYADDCAVGLHPHEPERMLPVPLLIGTMRDEFVNLPLAQRADAISQHAHPIRRAYTSLLISWLSRRMGAPRVASDRKQWADYCAEQRPPRPLARAISDAAVRQFAMQTAEAHQDKASTWVYEFHSGGRDGCEAQHCGDLPLLFDCLDVEPARVAEVCGPNAKQRLQPLATRFHGLVADFAKGIDPDWPRYDATTGRKTKLFDMSDCSEEVVNDAHAPVRRFFL